jgi:hypothetical protein
MAEAPYPTRCAKWRRKRFQNARLDDSSRAVSRLNRNCMRYLIYGCLISLPAYSFTCANGICENNCRSMIMFSRRSNWKNVAAFFPGNTWLTTGRVDCCVEVGGSSSPGSVAVNKIGMYSDSIPQRASLLHGPLQHELGTSLDPIQVGISF